MLRHHSGFVLGDVVEVCSDEAATPVRMSARHLAVYPMKTAPGVTVFGKLLRRDGVAGAREDQFQLHAPGLELELLLPAGG